MPRPFALWIYSCSGWLWRFQWYRLLCIKLACAGWFVGFVFECTPIAVGLRQLFLESGDYPRAAEISAWLRRGGP